MVVGRDEERRRIGDLLDAARDGRGGALVVAGEAGMGKTALLEEAVEQAADMRVLRARGVETEAMLPYAGLLSLLISMLDLIEAIPKPQADALRVALALS